MNNYYKEDRDWSGLQDRHWSGLLKILGDFIHLCWCHGSRRRHSPSLATGVHFTCRETLSTGTNILWNGGSEAKRVTFAPSSGKLEGPPKFNHWSKLFTFGVSQAISSLFRTFWWPSNCFKIKDGTQGTSDFVSASFLIALMTTWHSQADRNACFHWWLWVIVKDLGG